MLATLARLRRGLAVKRPLVSSRAYSGPSGYSIRTLTEQDKKPVVDLLTRFYSDEPVNSAMGPAEMRARVAMLEDRTAYALPHGVSVAAVDEDQQIVGIILSEIVKRGESVYCPQSYKSCEDPRLRCMLQVTQHLTDSVNPWDLLPKTCNSLMYMKITAVHSDWRSKGICSALAVDATINAKSIGAGALLAYCTSAYSASAIRVIEAKKVYAVRYEDLAFVPRVDPPHVEAAVFIKEI